MVKPVKIFAHAISKDQFTKWFSLYPPSDFEQDVKNYNARKGPGDPIVSVHYFRVSRILRDLLFTCSSFDFSYHMVKHTQKSLQANFTAARVYDLNQSVYNPLWNAAGMPYVGVSHGSDTNYVFNGVFPEGEMDESDKDLSKSMTSSFINFVHTGDPNSQSPSTKKTSYWPEAYDNVGSDTADLMPSQFNLLVVGGPYGTKAVNLSYPLNGAASSEYKGVFDGYTAVGKLQQIIGNVLDFGAMGTSVSLTLKDKIQQESLFERCTYVNSLAETLGV